MARREVIKFYVHNAGKRITLDDASRGRRGIDVIISRKLARWETLILKGRNEIIISLHFRYSARQLRTYAPPWIIVTQPREFHRVLARNSRSASGSTIFLCTDSQLNCAISFVISHRPCEQRFVRDNAWAIIRTLALWVPFPRSDPVLSFSRGTVF